MQQIRDAFTLILSTKVFHSQLLFMSKGLRNYFQDDFSIHCSGTNSIYGNGFSGLFYNLAPLIFHFISFPSK